MRRKRTDGFTLVELMVVVLIIGILVAMAVPVFNAARERAQEKACFANQRMILAAVQAAIAVKPGFTEKDFCSSQDGLPGLVPEYLMTMPRCPSITDHANHHYYWGAWGVYSVWMHDDSGGFVRGCLVHSAGPLQ